LAAFDAIDDDAIAMMTWLAGWLANEQIE